MKFLVCIIALFFFSTAFTQTITKANNLIPDVDYENIHVKKIGTNKHSTSFIIWIKDNVKVHKHEKHTESLYVIEGTGIMTIGNTSFDIEAGDFFVIPEGEYHSLKVTSKIPVKVISMQAPEFNGEDRVFKTD